MKVSDFFERYHVSPLTYADGTELNDKDWSNLYLFLTKVYRSKELADDGCMPTISKFVCEKVEKSAKSAIFPLTSEEVMDMFMNERSSPVLTSVSN